MPPACWPTWSSTSSRALTSDARALAKDCLHLEISSREEHRELADRLEAHYRNANFRIAVTETLLNRLMPERDPEYAVVRDTVLDTPVRGKSMTSTEVAVRMLPDPNRVRMALEVTGQVESLTRSTSGPVTFYNGSDSTYVASKPMEVDLRGIRLWPAEVKVYNNTRLRGMATDFDGVPLVGSLVQEVARDQHERKREAAEDEIKQKVASKAKQRIDSESDARLTKVTERFRQRIVGAAGGPFPGSGDGRRGNDRRAVHDAVPAGRRGPVGQPHAAAAGPVG